MLIVAFREQTTVWITCQIQYTTHCHNDMDTNFHYTKEAVDNPPHFIDRSKHPLH